VNLKTLTRALAFCLLVLVLAALSMPLQPPGHAQQPTGRVHVGVIAPDGAVIGSAGDLYFDTAHNKLYFKFAGVSSRTGWVLVLDGEQESATEITGLTNLETDDLLVNDDAEVGDDLDVGGDLQVAGTITGDLTGDVTAALVTASTSVTAASYKSGAQTGVATASCDVGNLVSFAVTAGLITALSCAP
jgi:hypothetical protein